MKWCWCCYRRRKNVCWKVIGSHCRTKWNMYLWSRRLRGCLTVRTKNNNINTCVGRHRDRIERWKSPFECCSRRVYCSRLHVVGTHSTCCVVWALLESVTAPRCACVMNVGVSRVCHYRASAELQNCGEWGVGGWVMALAGLETLWGDTDVREIFRSLLTES